MVKGLKMLGGGSGVDEEKTRWGEKEVVGEEESSWKKTWCEGKRLWRERRRRDPTSSSSFTIPSLTPLIIYTHTYTYLHIHLSALNRNSKSKTIGARVEIEVHQLYGDRIASVCQ
ncbi:hypothetical protein QVD17_10762 [Tagetes erecta]|uniref:Uncharacterized protein n=1 Tax=Tagetes erecta TaxID=13708 RepID=A0AAD8L1T4_TARER|nr:hypothetical protein QVD17_10762 [Tagetes erecta]